MAIKFNGDKPIYEQIIEYIKIKISSGDYKSGEKFPSVRDLAIELGVNPNTVQRSLSELEREGLLVTRRGEGRYLPADIKTDNMRRELALCSAKKFLNEMAEMGFNVEEIISLLAEIAKTK